MPRRGHRTSGGFPGGTVSGAPKIRAMQIIAEKEPEKRGIYAGCSAISATTANGLLHHAARLWLRTAHAHPGRRRHRFDSSPAAEQNECVAKARALFRSAEEAVRFAVRGKRGQ